MSIAVPLSQPFTAVQSRDAGLDIARGIAMVLVVFGHALDGVQSAGFSTQTLRFVMILVYAVHVPLFFLISGVLARGTCRLPWQTFVSVVSARLLWPYVLWAFILLTALYVMGNHTNTGLQRYQPLSILWRAPAVLWFLYVMFIGMVMLRLMVSLPNYAILAVGTLCLLMPYLSDDWPQKSRFIGMFLIGAALGPAALRIALEPVAIATAAGIMMVTGGLALHMAQAPISGYPAFAIPFIPAIFAGPVLIYALGTWMARLGPNWVLTVIGHNTMAIFVTHILVTAGVRIVLLHFGVTDWWLIILLATGAGVLVPLAAALAAKRAGLSRGLGWQ